MCFQLLDEKQEIFSVMALCTLPAIKFLVMMVILLDVNAPYGPLTYQGFIDIIKKKRLLTEFTHLFIYFFYHYQ